MKYSKCFPAWGPYGKKYMGLSRIADHDFKKGIGVRFDFTVAPAIFGTNIAIPNVTVPSGCHPWLSSKDYSFYSYRYDLEWKDRVYADVSFSKINDEATLVRTEIVNNTELTHNCLINFFSSIEYPYEYYTKLSAPEKSIYIEGTSYSEYTYANPRPWDGENPDGFKKGEFRCPDFVNETGLGDRVGKWHMPHKYFGCFGADEGDKVSYQISAAEHFRNPVLAIRYRTCDMEYRQGEMVGVELVPGKNDAVFTLNGKTDITFSATDDLKFTFCDLESADNNAYNITLASKGAGGVEIDFLLILEKDDRDKLFVTKEYYRLKPDITEVEADKGYISKLDYKDIGGEFILKTFNGNTRFRYIETGCLEDAPTARLSNSDVTFDDVLESFTDTFTRKKSDEGFFHNAIVHTLFVEPNSSHIEYAVISNGEMDYLSVEEYEKLYLQRKGEAVVHRYNKSGEKYALSNQILSATLLTNAVYPIYKYGENIVHHTPGKRWDCLYTWDSGFIGLGMTELSRDFANYSLETYLSDENNKDYAFLHHGSPVPVQMYLYLELLKLNNDKDKLLSLYPRVKMYYDFLAGKINGSTCGKFKSGLTTTYDYFYSSSGMDDYPAQVLMMDKNIRGISAPAISSSQLVRCAKILKMVALRLGNLQDAEVYEADIKRVGDALNKYSWDDEAGYYSYVLHDENGEPTGILKTDSGENVNKGLDGIYPIIAGVCNENQRERIIANMENPEKMCSPYGISAVDMTAGYFMVNGYWNGNVWFPHQWFIWKTMLDCGKANFAFKIAKMAMDIWKREVDYSYYTFEMVNVVTGRGGWFHNFGGLSAPINLWTAAYYKAGTFNSGFDVWVENQQFNDDNTTFSAEFSYNGNNEKYTLIIAMNDNKSDYKVCLDGKEVEYVLRDNSAIEVTLGADEKKHRLIIDN